MTPAPEDVVLGTSDDSGTTILIPVLHDEPGLLFRTVGSVLSLRGVGSAVLVHIVLARDVRACRPLAAALARRSPQVRVRGSDSDTLAQLLLEALPRVTTGFVAVLEPGDLALGDGLPALVRRAHRRPRPEIVYGDEQWTQDGQLVVRRKPHLSPTRLEADNYIGRPALIATNDLRAVGGWRAAAGEAVEWDVCLRLVADGTRRVEHLPLVGVHRGRSPFDGDPAAARRVLQDHLNRIGSTARVEAAALPGQLRVVRAVPDPPPLVSVVVPTAGVRRDVDGVETTLVLRVVEGLLERTEYTNWELVVVISDHAPADLESELLRAGDERLRAVRLPPGRFNFSVSINTGVEHTRGPLLLLLNDDIDPLSPTWLTEMVAAVQDPGVGVVGAKLLFPDGTIQHAGVAHDDDFRPIHPQFERPDGQGDFGDLDVAVDYAAVTAACMLTTREVFERVGGLWPGLPVAYGDVDYCWKVATVGKRCVVAPRALLRHDESSSRPAGVEPEELKTYLELWDEHARHDLSVHIGTAKW